MRSIWFLILLGSLITYHCLTTVSGEEPQKSTDAPQPTFDQCKPYVDAALKTSEPAEVNEESQEDGSQEQASVDDSGQPPDKPDSKEENGESEEADKNDSDAQEESQEAEDATNESQESQEAEDQPKGDDVSEAESKENEPQSEEAQRSAEETNEEDTTAEETEPAKEGETNEDETQEQNGTHEESQGESEEPAEESQNGDDDTATQEDSAENAQGDDPGADSGEASQEESAEQDGGEQVSAEESEETEEKPAIEENATDEEEGKSEEDDKSTDGDTKEDTGEEAQSDGSVQSDVADEADQPESGESKEDQETQEDTASTEDKDSPEAEAGVSEDKTEEESTEEASQEESEETAGGSDEEEEEEEHVEPYEPRSRDHIVQILGLDDSEQTKTTFSLLDKVTQTTLKELKNTYENAIKPLEQLYKYRDLSNRHFGDPEIFSKPLIVFMGPWSGGKSTIINWLLGIQHEDNALRTGADPSPAQFNIMMHGKEPEKLDGTQLAADWTFSGLQKFGQSFLDRLRGQKLPNRLLEKVNIVEIPGILEVRKQVERSFPFNDACQWFIDRADTLFLIYDPAKLDIGPETEAILDQLKGRENQVRIVLNKADTVKPDELLRVQAMLVWNISPLMSSAEPPVLYAASLWDRPLQVESPKSLLISHENNFLKDIRDGIERRVETRIAAARRFAVRVRNHAKMVDCYLNTYNNHRSFFSDKKKVSTDIIDHPQNYHIYEGLSTLTNISRYDLPDPDTYRDFFRLNPLWDFPTLQSTCSFWRGCPLHKLDIAIAYDLPEILGKFRRQRESILAAKTQSSKN